MPPITHPPKKTNDAVANTHFVVADDHPLFRGALRQAVTRILASSTVDEAGSFDELTNLLNQDRDVDLIMLDLTMPHPNGGETLRAIRDMDPEAPVILMSGYTEEAMRDSVGETNPTAFLQKPYNLGVLKQMLEDVIRESKAG